MAQFIKIATERQTFFVWLAPYDAHREWSANDQFNKPYMPEEVIVPPTLVDIKETRQDLAFYYNEISRIDHYLGELQKELEAQGIEDNTIIIFTSDNARPFPGNKTRVLDRGLKTPFVVKWPKGITEKGKNIPGLVSSIDIAPTHLELAGVNPTESIQGTSFVKLLKTPEAPFRNYIFGEHNWHDYQVFERSVRTKDFLYLINTKPELTNERPIDANQSPSAKALKKAKIDGTITAYQNEIFILPRPSEEFYDNQKDPLQEHNLINDKSYETGISDLKKVLSKWQSETGDTDPKNVTPDWYDRENGKELPAKGTRGEMPGRGKIADKVNNKGPF